MGLIIKGKMIEFPGSERIRDGRKVGAWWGRDEFGTGPREGDITLLTGHWTAGEAGVKDPDGPGPLTEYDDDGARVVSSMKNRVSTKRPGQPLQVSIQFVVGACAPDAPFANIWQTMDLGWNTAIHVGERIVNRRSIGIETVNSGAHGGPLDVRNRASSKRRLIGAEREYALFYPGQIQSLVWLADVLTSHEEMSPLGAALRDAGIRIPRQVPVENGVLFSKRMTEKQMRKWKGSMEHFHVWSTNKIDAALMFCDACVQAGFKAVEV